MLKPKNPVRTMIVFRRFIEIIPHIVLLQSTLHLKDFTLKNIKTIWIVKSLKDEDQYE
jgi:hypothetical protein